MAWPNPSTWFLKRCLRCLPIWGNPPLILRCQCQLSNIRLNGVGRFVESNEASVSINKWFWISSIIVWIFLVSLYIDLTDMFTDEYCDWWDARCARALVVIGQYDAVTQYQQLLALFRDLGSHDKEAIVLSSLGQIYQSLGQKAKGKRLKPITRKQSALYRILGDSSWWSSHPQGWWVTTSNNYRSASHDAHQWLCPTWRRYWILRESAIYRVIVVSLVSIELRVSSCRNARTFAIELRNCRLVAYVFCHLWFWISFAIASVNISDLSAIAFGGGIVRPVPTKHCRLAV